MTVEPPRGIKANLLRSYSSFTDDYLNSCGIVDSSGEKQFGERSLQFKHLLQVDRHLFLPVLVGLLVSLYLLAISK